jgi:hypothetical protein
LLGEQITNGCSRELCLADLKAPGCVSKGLSLLVVQVDGNGFID